jgi:hypothetical protein
MRITDEVMKRTNCRNDILVGLVASSLLVAMTQLVAQSPNSVPTRAAKEKTPSKSAQTQAGKEEEMKDKMDGRHDFDFLFGRWKVDGRRLARRLEGCSDWQALPAENETRPVLGGLGNIDKFTATFPNGKLIEGMTLRFFDPKTRLWSIYWVDNWTCQLQPPVVGRFNAGRGEFSGDDTFKGKPIRVRFIWVKKSPNSAHWEQAFSEDSGKTWETNWEMEITRE